MDRQEIRDLLHSTPVRRSHRVRVGERVQIDLPSIPLTAATEFVQLATEIKGDQNNLVEESVSDEGEGFLAPRQIVGRALRPGKAQIIVKAVDALSGADIPGVEPLTIDVDIEDD